MEHTTKPSFSIDASEMRSGTVCFHVYWCTPPLPRASFRSFLARDAYGVMSHTWLSLSIYDSLLTASTVVAMCRNVL